MTDEIKIETGSSGTSVKTGGTSVTTDVEPVYHSLMEYTLYKMDRSLAIFGIIGIAVVALFVYAGAEGVQIATGAIGGLVGYVGGRTGK